MIAKIQQKESEATSQRVSDDEPFLAPIENPEDPGMQQIYAFYQTNFGRVITPLRVHSARLPIVFAQFYGKIGELDRQLQLPTEIALLVRQQVARINVCLFCIDSNRWASINQSMDPSKMDALDHYTTSPLFTEKERVALDYVTELTREKKVEPKTFEKLSNQFSEREICEIAWLVASEHLYNMTNIGLNIHSDMLCKLPGKQEAKR